MPAEVNWVSPEAFTAYGTLALSIVTVVLAVATFRMVSEAAKARTDVDNAHQETLTPILKFAEFPGFSWSAGTATLDTNLVNFGTGPALNVKLTYEARS